MDMLSVKCMQLAILLATTWLLHGYTFKGTQKGTTCSAASEGRSGRITCHFSENLNVTKQAFSVRRSRLDGTDTVWVVDCTLVSSGPPECFIDPLYIFNGEVSQEAVIHIPVLRDEHDTRYWCQAVPSEYSLVETCSFKSPDQRSGSQRTTEIRQEIVISNNDNAHGDTSRVSPGAMTSIVVILWLLLLFHF